MRRRFSILAAVFLTRGPRVFVILLNYRSAGDTLRCLSSLRLSRERGIYPVVVDNASGTAEVDRLRRALGPTVPLLVCADNAGYAAGNNVGIRHALRRDADFVWVLNPDTEVEPATLQLMMAAMALRPDAGIVGSLNLVGGSDPPIIHFAGGTIDWEAGAITETIGRGKPLASRIEREPYRVDYVTGASMLIRREVFEDVGLLPEHYFLYFEETDFQVEASRRGWASVIEPLARIRHYQRSGADLPSPYYIYYYVRGRILFGRKFTDHGYDKLIAGLDRFIGGWRARVVERAPHWLETYDRLVEWGLEDGRADLTGPRADVNAMAGAA